MGHQNPDLDFDDTRMILQGASCTIAAWFIASIGVQLGFHINVGTDFVPNTRLAPLIERLAPPFDERAVL